MSIELQQIFSAFLIGLLGGSHCVAMCGGIVSAISMQQPGKSPSIYRSLFYNFGRIISYTTAGFIFTSLGLALSNFGEIKQVQLLLSIFASFILILMGLYIAGWLNWILKVEVLGNWVWKIIEPLGRKFLPIEHNYQAVIVGMVWGWLPCGLVYSVLIWSLSANSTLQGGLLMFGFGLGTLPNLLTISIFTDKIAGYLQNSWVKSIAGLVIIGFAIHQLLVIGQQNNLLNSF